MGSTADEVLTEDGHEVTVLVTGFGPFRTQNPINPSWEIARLLPPFLPPLPATSLSSQLSLLTPPPVRILVHPEPIRVSYTTVRNIVPELWKDRKIDYMIHIGMASGRKFYSIERRGHRDGYYMKDVDNQFLNDEALHKKMGKDWVWEGMPSELLSTIDVDDVWKRWRVNLTGEDKEERDVRVSEDAGRYLCDFIYFSSLAELEKKGEDKRVLFLHVPVEADEVSVKKGVEITTELIRAVVVSGMMKEVKKVAAEMQADELR
ncbi:peptidase C15, pyroglutamyl peptidase I-like protein [Mollisia scopiformis]|uniref:Peptidase C15, pyroglutamyl peptidase I-like protein n=1 Tax=Mollisia scopiformis TaxID=149040 RepID=A0A194XEM6_MOLSC|nr:peptidase C15, pyroglutamyl peptidase I-like protein [Mollisia scopiformis]KUJ18601.1 peptidase C15, pyroglutamyl peptidase I-like protein [Mollisia scopiformis]